MYISFLFNMNVSAVLLGVLGVIAYFFYLQIGSSTRGDDGQGVNKDFSADFSNPIPSAKEQKGQWD